MLLWIGFAGLTGAALIAVLYPLLRRGTVALDPLDADLSVYRDQLSEIEAEGRRGHISEAEVAGARAEVGRRLLRRAERSGGESIADDAQAAGGGYTVPLVCAFVSLFSIAVYLAAGSPHLPGRPFNATAAVSAAKTPVVELIARVEQRLREAPEDGRGWDVIAPVYMRLQRYADAAHAYAEANRRLGESLKRLLGFAEARLLAQDGLVGEDVRRAAERILELEPGRREARVWLALAKEQDGDLRGAISDYEALRSEAPEDAPWRGVIDKHLSRLKDRLAGKAPVLESQAGQVGKMSGPEREAFIAKMVGGLARRLKSDGKDLAGWLKLIRAYSVLGRKDDAVAALGEARRNFQGDGRALDDIERLAKSLGLGS
jgi:cytochrome c-type biogenesis protein CcmH